MNQTTLAGHLGADPEVRFTSSGQKVTTFRIASKVRKGSKDDTIWWRVSVWGEQFDKMIPYFKKGSPIVAVGEMNKPEIFTDKDGRPQISMSLTAFSITFSPFGKPDSNHHEAGSHDSVNSSSSHTSETTAGVGNHSFSHDDEVPF
jgi:single-strand DNA-binding protein